MRRACPSALAPCNDERRAACQLVGIVWFLTSQLSDRTAVPRSFGGTLQLSTRCSSLALLLRRSFPVLTGAGVCPEEVAVAGATIGAGSSAPTDAAMTVKAPVSNAVKTPFGLGILIPNKRLPATTNNRRGRVCQALRFLRWIAQKETGRLRRDLDAGDHGVVSW